MKKLIKSLVLCFATIVFVACNKTDDPVTAYTAKPYSEVIPGEMVEIEKFLDTYSMEVDADQNVTFTEVSTGTNLQSIRTQYSDRLKYKIVKYNDYDFKVYYIQHTEGVNKDLRPCPIDSAFVAYKGLLLKKKTNYDSNKTFEENQMFDQKQNPVWFDLSRLTYGFGYMTSCLLPGNHSVDSNTNVVNYSGYGSSVIFLPSGLGYYDRPPSFGKITAYSPLIFNIKLMKVNFIDHDLDQIDSRDENYETEVDASDPQTTRWKKLDRNTDGDPFPDFYDQDDDNDGVKTKDEMRNPSGGFYTFLTVPTCGDGKKRVYSKECH